MFLFLSPSLDPIPETQSRLAVTGAFSFQLLPRGQFRSESLHCHSIAEFALCSLVMSHCPHDITTPPQKKKQYVLKDFTPGQAQQKCCVFQKIPA